MDNEYKSAIEFNDELLSTDAFSCTKCGNVLSPPVLLANDIGNICYSCSTNLPVTESHLCLIPNKALETLFEKMYLVCPFRTAGCNERLTHRDLIVHKQSCKFRSMKCILSELCDWEGQLETLMDHIMQSHADRILNSHSNKFTIVNNWMQELEAVHVLSTGRATFLFHIKINDNNQLLYKLHDLDHKANSYKISVKHVGESQHHLKTSCAITNLLDSYSFNQEEATQVDLKVLKEVVQPKDTFTTIVRLKEVEGTEHLTENVLHHFECPVCKNFMKPPIYQCTSGHSVCNLCKPRLERCPTCRANFGNTRNYSMEGLTSKVHYPCIFHDQGCGESGLASDISVHESLCNYRPYTCFFQGCLFNGNHSSLRNHLTQAHGDKAFIGNTHHFTMGFYMDKYVGTKRFAIISEDQIFKFSYKQSLDYTYWAVDLELSQNSFDTLTFVYEIGLIDIRKPEKKLIKTDTCLKVASDEDLFRKCSSLPNNIVMGFSNNCVINFYIKITKVA